MDFVFLPYQAVITSLILIGAAVGAVWCRRWSKSGGAIAGAIAAFLIISIIKLVAPVKLTTNTVENNARQDAAVMRRHLQPLPPRVEIKRLSYEEELAQKNKALRSLGDGK